MKVTRRHLIDLAVRAAALPASAIFFSEWLSAGQENGHHHQSAPTEPDLLKNYAPKFFSAEDFEALESFTEILIPQDEAPGARQASCASFIDFVLEASTEYAPETQEHWRKAMQTLKNAGFHAADAEGRARIVEAISRPERDGSPRTAEFAAYQLIKRENTFAFYTSREGMIETLDYRGDSYNLVFPACTHPEHHAI